MDARIRMKAWREWLGLSKREFARAMNVVPATVTMWEHPNYRHGPSRKNILRLCELASITPARFWGALPRKRRGK